MTKRGKKFWAEHSARSWHWEWVICVHAARATWLFIHCDCYNQNACRGYSSCHNFMYRQWWSGCNSIHYLKFRLMFNRLHRIRMATGIQVAWSRGFYNAINCIKTQTHGKCAKPLKFYWCEINSWRNCLRLGWVGCWCQITFWCFIRCDSWVYD